MMHPDTLTTLLDYTETTPRLLRSLAILLQRAENIICQEGYRSDAMTVYHEISDIFNQLPLDNTGLYTFNVAILHGYCYQEASGMGATVFPLYAVNRLMNLYVPEECARHVSVNARFFLEERRKTTLSHPL